MTAQKWSLELVINVLAEKHLSTDKLEELKVDDFLPGYGHDNELAADREGVKLAIEAGYSPKGTRFDYAHVHDLRAENAEYLDRRTEESGGTHRTDRTTQ